MIKISIILLALVVLISGISVYSLAPKLKLETEEQTVNVFDEYKDISYSATSMGSDITDRVVKDGEVDIDNIGKYTITYTVKNGFFKTTKKLIVNVVDTVAPELELINGNEYNVCSLDRFIEPGYSSIDNYDGDITGNVEKDYVKDDEIEYRVSDSSGNKSTQTRKLIVGDNNKPDMSLNGDETVYVTKGSSYTEAGVSVNDNCDGDLSKAVTIDGKVNTSKKGTYEIKYSVKDSSGNENSIVRKVVVQEKKESNKNTNTNTNTTPNTNESGVIYLTFDDGPGAYTQQILNTLDKYGVKATFFVTNQFPRYQGMIAEEAHRGHSIGVHTLTHQWNIYDSVESYWNDFNAMQDIILKQTGKTTNILRFPGGTSNRKAKVGMSNIVREVDAKGYKYFDWNVSVEDSGACAYKKDAKSCVISYFKTYLKPNRSNIVLMHDIKSFTANALDEMISYAKSRGYTFKPIDENTEPIHYKPYK